MSAPFGGRYDVVIAGARCAGASTALLLARQGARVLVVDPLPRGRDALSTHALMRGAVTQLHRWGLLDAVRAAGTPTIARTTFDYEDETVTVPIEPRDGVDGLYAPRRTVLDPILEDAAVDAGAHVVRGWALAGLARHAGGRVRGVVLRGPSGRRVAVRTDVLVGADGMRSTAARLVRAPVRHRGRHATASVYGYWRGLGETDTRWYFRPRLGMGTIPTNDDDTCVFVSLPRDRFDEARRSGLARVFHQAVCGVDPSLAERLAAGATADGLRAFAGMPGYLRRCAGPGWALVGDAGYFKDPLTAHGITDALRDAELLAAALGEGTDRALARYQRLRDRAAGELMAITDRIASLEWGLDEVKSLHRGLSRAMKGAAEVLVAA